MEKRELDFATDKAPGGPEARKWASTFVPVDGVDYDWAVESAEKQYAALRASFDKLDEKATHIINYLASGAGLFTLGSLAGIATAKVPQVAVWCAIPSMVFAVIAIVLALLARWPRRIFAPPSSETMAEAAQRYPSDVKRGRALMLPQWQWATALLKGTIEDKAWYFAWASNFMGGGVILLLLPLLVMLASGEASQPPHRN